ncbi:MAG: hypothetical protein ACYC1U_11340 [Candidatus Aquicultorales bacterium]
MAQQELSHKEGAFDAEAHWRKLREKSRAEVIAALSAILAKNPRVADIPNLLDAAGFEITRKHEPLNLVGVDMDRNHD